MKGLILVVALCYSIITVAQENALYVAAAGLMSGETGNYRQSAGEIRMLQKSPAKKRVSKTNASLPKGLLATGKSYL
jgi:hypothetical protein